MAKSFIQKGMKILLIGGGIVLVGFAIFLTLGIFMYSIKEGDNEIFTYLTVPVIAFIIGIYMIAKGIRSKSPS